MVTTEQAHSGHYGLKLSIDTRGPVRAGVRMTREKEYQQVPRGAYFSVWYYLPQAVQAPEWWNIFQFKAKTAPGRPAEPFWSINIGNRPDSGAMYLWVDNKDGAPQPKAQYRSPLTRLDIPVGRWWHLEAYMERTASYDGHLTIWQDGVKLYDFTGVRSTYPGGLVEWTVNNYADDLSPAPTTLYIDDAAISTAQLGPGQHPDD